MKRYFAVAFVLLLGGSVGLVWFGRTLVHRPLELTQPKTVDVGAGERLVSVLDELSDAGVMSLPQRWALRAYARLTGKATRIRAGEFRLEPGDTPLLVLDLLISGRVVLHELRIIEGWRFAQAWQAVIADADLKHTLPPTATPDAVMAAIGHKGEAAEGMFFPDTYRFPRGESDVDFLKRAYDSMQQHLNAAWAGRADKLPLQKPYDALIMASLVEKETALASERARIAGVFTRRLNIGMRLQTDPTVIYGMGDAYHGNIRRKDLTTDTPYNTYTRAGLPPTPICLPGDASLQAAVHPADGTSLFFVAKGDGSHAFADTLEQQDANIKRYQLGGK